MENKKKYYIEDILSILEDKYKMSKFIFKTVGGKNQLFLTEHNDVKLNEESPFALYISEEPITKENLDFFMGLIDDNFTVKKNYGII